MRGGEFDGSVSESRLLGFVCASGSVVTLLAIEWVATFGELKPPTKVLVLINGDPAIDPALDVGRDCGIPA